MKIEWVAILGGALLLAVLPGQAKASSQTSNSLQRAFQGECNAVYRYQLFARKAEADGDKYVARLFRAAAVAEAIHRDNVAKAIVATGGEVINDITLDEPKLGTTAENLRFAIRGETDEHNRMYAGFLKRAEIDRDKQAFKAILYAQKTEGEHARLYQAALKNLGRNPDVPIYVCGGCGYTTTRLPTRACPICREPSFNYQRVD